MPEQVALDPAAAASAKTTGVAPHDAPEQKDAKSGSGERRVHMIRVADLVTHKYSESAVLLRKANKIAEEFINADLRPGEYMQKLKPGVIRVYLPKLTPEAGALRCSVMADSIAREIQRINPGKVSLPESADTLIDKREQARARLGLNGIRKAAVSSSRDKRLPTDEEMRRQATGAIQLMIPGNRLTLEELIGKSNTDPDNAPVLSFEPVWQASRNVVSSFRCDLQGIETCQEKVPEIAGVKKAQVDAMLAIGIKPLIQASIEAGRSCLFILPVHFATLENSTLRPAYLEALTSIPAPFSQYIVLELTDVPIDASHYRLGEVSGYLRGRCRSVLCRIDLKTVDFEKFKELGFFAVGAEINEKLPDAQLFALMEKFSAGAERRRQRPYLTGVSRKSLLTAAMGSGFKLLSGPAVMDGVDSPFGVKRAELDALYRTDGYGLRTAT